MTAIVVCIPRTKQAEVEREEVDVARRIAAGERGITYYWTLSRVPRQSVERVYFLWNGSIRAYHRCLDVLRSPPRAILDPQIVELPEPVPMRSFRGFRYWTPLDSP